MNLFMKTYFAKIAIAFRDYLVIYIPDTWEKADMEAALDLDVERVEM